MALRTTQFFVLAFTAWLLYLLAVQLGSRRAAAVTAVLCAIYPQFVFSAAYYADVTLSTFLAVAIVVGLFFLLKRAHLSALHFVAVGGALAILSLVRPGFLLMGAFVAFGMVIMQRSCALPRRLLLVTALLVGNLMIIAPWIARNTLLAEQLTNVSSAGGWSLYVSSQQYTDEISPRLLRPEWDIVIAEFNRRTKDAEEALPADAVLSDPHLAVKREVFRDRRYIQDALRTVGLLSWHHLLARWPNRVFWLWSTGDVSPWQVGLLHRLIQLHHILLALCVLVGLFLSRSALAGQWLLWFPALYLTMLHMVFHVEARYTFEARAFLLVYAGLAIDWVITRVEEPSRPNFKASVASVLHVVKSQSSPEEGARETLSPDRSGSVTCTRAKMSNLN